MRIKHIFGANNVIFGKTGRVASKEVVLSLTKLFASIILYGLEAFTLNESTLHSSDLTVNRFFVQLFLEWKLSLNAKNIHVQIASVMLADCIYNLQRKMESVAALF
jgi:hypothetical protein